MSIVLNTIQGEPPSAAEALQLSLAICKNLGAIADKFDEVAHPEDSTVCTFAPGSFVKAVFDSGGDPEDHIPAFSRGDKFCVIAQHEGGWLEVVDGYLLASWVTKCDTPPDSQAIVEQAMNQSVLQQGQSAQPESNVESQEGPVELAIERGRNKLGLQIAGGSADHPGIFVKKVRLRFKFSHFSASYDWYGWQ